MPRVHQTAGLTIMPRLRVYTECSDQSPTGRALFTLCSGIRSQRGRGTVSPTSRRLKSQTAAPLKTRARAPRKIIAPTLGLVLISAMASVGTLLTTPMVSTATTSAFQANEAARLTSCSRACAGA